MNANEGMLLALSSGLDRLNAAATKNLAAPIIPSTCPDCGSDNINFDIYRGEKISRDDVMRSCSHRWHSGRSTVPVQDLDMPRTLTAGQISNYLGNGGEHCPDCLSTDISGGSVDISAGHATQHMDCSHCGLQWDDEYELATIRRTRFGVKSKEPVVSYFDFPQDAPKKQTGGAK